jgi:hypothetical protein
MKRDLLLRPFRPDQIKTRTRDGKQLYFVEANAVLERLNEVSDHAWTFQVQRYDILENEVVVLGRLEMGGVVKMDIGSAPLTRDATGAKTSIGDDAKAACTDAIKRCARLFGIGLPLHTSDTTGARTSAAPVASLDRLTERQLAALHAACRRKGWRIGRLSDVVGARFKKNDVAALTRSEASSLITEISGASDH